MIPRRTLRFASLALALAAALRAADAPPAPPPEQPSAQEENRKLSDELASSWKETDQLKAQVADLQKQLDAAKAAKPEAPPAPEGDAQDRLATVLRSYSLLQDEDAGLHGTVDKLTGENASLKEQLETARSAIAALQVQAAATALIDPLRTQLRQTQDEVASLAAENAQLRTRLALEAPVPGSTQPAPMRPERVAAEEAAAPTPTPTPPPVKTYVVVEGDTLTRISRKFYGTTARWPDILKANTDVLKDEKSLVVGSTLKIP